MIVFWLDLIGAPCLLGKQSLGVAKTDPRLQLFTIFDILVDPENGEIQGYLIEAKSRFALALVAEPEALSSSEKIKYHNKKLPRSVVAINDTEVSEIGSGFIRISSPKGISAPTEIIRIKNIIDKNIKIIGQKVETEMGQKVGVVKNATLNTSKRSLDKIYVSPKFILGAFSAEKIIPLKNIVEINSQKIIVKDAAVKIGSEQRLMSAIEPIEP